MQLSQSQKDAVFSPWRKTVSLILSTAGSGKTIVLTHRAVRIAIELARENQTNSRVLCICFNVSAAEEMAQRITDLIRKDGYRDKVLVTRQHYHPKDMVTIEIRTFHALGYWVLRSAHDSERESVGLRQGTMKLVSGVSHLNLIIEALVEAGLLDPSRKKTQKNFVARHYEANFREHTRFVLEIESERFLSQNDGEPQRKKSRHLLSRKAFEIYQRRMQEQNCITYDDMIGKSVALLRQAGGIHEKIGSRYAAVLVDEFQDLTPAEFVMCKAFIENSRALTLVGDDDQQIYSFRNSRTWFCHEMVAAWFPKNLKVLQLPENWRCPAAVVKSAAAVISKNKRRASKDIVAVLPLGNPVRIVGCKDLGIEIKFVVSRIKSLLPVVRERKEQILVLFRTTALLNTFQKHLQMADVATSRVLVEPQGADNIGSKTSATFALICLMSKKLDRATFLWAVVTVSDLEREFIESIIDTTKTDGKVEKSHQTVAVRSDCNQGGKRQCENSVHERPHVSEKPYPSPYLESLTAWYYSKRHHEMGPPQQRKFKSLHHLLNMTERLTHQLRNLNTAKNMVRSAEEIISTTGAGNYEDYIQSFQGEAEDASSDLIADGKGGFNLLISAARDIDEKALEECEESEKLMVDTGRAENAMEGYENKDADTVDFSSLFGLDKKAAKRSRRKVGISCNVDVGTTAEHRRKMGMKIDDFCETLGVTLTRYDRSGRTKVPRKERPSTVLSTIHKAKGTSFAFVFLCGANLWNMPVMAAQELDVADSIDKDAETNQEERRLFFVSLTRTMTEFTCTYSAPRGCGGEITKWRSIFIEELLDNLGECDTFATEWLIRKEKDILAAVGFLARHSNY